MKYKILKSQCMPNDYFSIGWDTFKRKRYIFPMWVEVGLTTTKDDVEVIDDMLGLKKAVQKENTFQVKGSKGNLYTVSISRKGNTCTCVGFEFRRNCKHINQIVNSI
jgi:hypothetical protein